MAVFKKIEKATKGSVVVTEETTNIYEELMKAQVKVTFFCASYFYHGTIEAVNGETIVLNGAKIVYETGAFNTNTFKDAQDLNTNQWFIRIPAIESFGVLDKK
jgi:hypothetical protein